MANVSQVNISNLTQLADVTRFLQPFITQVSSAMGNQLTIADNFLMSIVGVTFPSTANKTLQIQHNLSVTPTGYIPVMLSGPCSIYNGLGVSLTLTSQFANLACSSTSIFASILFF
jgi:hypothetical protein